MDQLNNLVANESHPLASELLSLRKAVAQFQEEAYNSSVKLQRHSLDSANALDRVAHLESENASLKRELEILRLNPHPDSEPEAHPAAVQLRQLTLSLRRLSDKLSLTEEALLERTTQLTIATGELTKAKFAAEGAYELASRIRGREEAGRSKELDLGRRLKAAEEAGKMSDIVVQEYAALVRSLEAKSSSSARPITGSHRDSPNFHTGEGTPDKGAFTLNHSLTEGKLGLQRLLAEFSTATEKLQGELLRVQGELELLENKGVTEKMNLDHNLVELAKVQFQLQQLILDDMSAAKMVSRYMKFSQKSTDTLQEALTTLKTRHKATIDTLYHQLSITSSQLQFSEGQIERLRHTLDELGVEIMKESYGRRREVALRIRMVNREEKIREDLERWVLRAEEGLVRDPESRRAVMDKMIRDARAFLSESLGGITAASPGSLARLLVAQNAVDSFSAELEWETARRLELEKIIAHDTPEGFIGDNIADGNNLKSNGKAVPVATSEELHPIPLNPAYRDKDLPPTSTPMSQIDNMSGLLRPALVVLSHNQSPNPPSASDLIPDDSLSSGELDMTRRLGDHNLVSNKESKGSLTASLPVPELPSPQAPREQYDEQSSNPTLTPTALIVQEQLVNFKKPQEPTESRLSIESENIDTEEVETAIALSHPPEIIAEDAFELMMPPPVTSGGGIALNQQPEHQAEISDNDHSSSLSDSMTPRDVSLPSLLAPSSVSDLQNLHSLPNVISTEVLQQSPHPLLTDLNKAKRRYDDLQHAFRDCHLALETLKNSLATILDSGKHSVPVDVLRITLQRLTDYTEDAHVELEIQIADEALIAQGFETLLSVPGALSSSPLPSSLNGNYADNPDAPSLSEAESQVMAFVSGEDPAIQKTHKSFSRKLEDIEHDIAALKRAVHDDAVEEAVPGTNGGGNDGNSGGSRWVSWIRSSPSAPSYLDSKLGSRSDVPAPTFGNVITSPHSRHSLSSNFLSHSRRTVSEGGAGASAEIFLASLGLKVPMPSYVHQSSPARAQFLQRPRTVSAMYMLGLGARSPSGSFPGSPRPVQKRAGPSPVPKLGDEPDGEVEVREDGGEDVE